MAIIVDEYGNPFRQSATDELSDIVRRETLKALKSALRPLVVLYGADGKMVCAETRVGSTVKFRNPCQVEAI